MDDSQFVVWRERGSQAIRCGPVEQRQFKRMGPQRKGGKASWLAKLSVGY